MTTNLNFLGLLLGYDVAKNLIGVALGNSNDKNISGINKQLPLFLGLSLESERIWANILVALGVEKTAILTNFLHSLKDYERNYFRHVIVGIRETKTSEMIINLDAKTVYGGGPVAFLELLIRIIKDKGNEEAKNICAAGNIIGDSSFQEVINKWREGVAWFNSNGLPMIADVIKNFFGVNNLSEITLEKIIAKVGELDNRIAAMIPKPIERRGFFKDAFGWMIPRRKK